MLRLPCRYVTTNQGRRSGRCRSAGGGGRAGRGSGRGPEDTPRPGGPTRRSTGRGAAAVMGGDIDAAVEPYTALRVLLQRQRGLHPHPLSR
jgi:hypothetical protein